MNVQVSSVLQLCVVVYSALTIKAHNVTEIASLVQFQNTEKLCEQCLETVVANYRLPPDGTVITNLNVRDAFRGNIVLINLDCGCKILNQPKLQLYILDISHGKEMSNFHKRLEQQCFNSRAKYVFVTDFENADEIAVFLKLLSHFYIWQVAIIDLDLNVYTYFPYKYANVNSPDLTAVKIGQCPKLSTHAISLRQPPHSEMWKNTTLKVYFKLLKPYANELNTGSEQRVLSEITKSLEIQVVSTLGFHKLQGIKKNGTYQDEGLKLLHQKKVQAVAGGYEAEPNLWKDFDVSPVIFIDSIRIFTPKSREIGPWTRMVCIFTSKSIFTLISVALVWSFFVKVAYGGDTFNLLFIVITLYNQQSVYNIGQYKFRITLYFTILGFFFISCSEVALLKQIFFTVLYEPELNSIKDVFGRDLTILASSEILQSFRASSRKLDRELSKRMLPCVTDISRCLRRVCIDRNAIMIAPAAPMIQQALDVCFDSLTGAKLYHLGEEIGRSYLQLYFSKGYPPHERFYDAINRYVLYAGIATKEKDHTYYRYQKILTAMPKFKSDSMQLKHLQLVLMVWFIGMVFSIFVLLVEVYVWRKMVEARRHKCECS